MNYNSGLYDTQSENFIIGSLMNSPMFIHEDGCSLIPADFYNKRNQLIFGVIYNLVSEGAEKISPQDVDSYLMRFPEQYRVYNENSGITALNTVSELGIPDKAIYQSHHSRIKKFSLLRDFEAIGIDSRKFYDNNSLLGSKLNEEFERMSVSDIISKVKEDLNTVEDRNISKTENTSSDAADNIEDLIDLFKTTPEVGEFLDGDIFNYAVKGARYGKFYLCSAPSGHGKTRQMVGQACNLAYPKIDNDGNIIMKKEYRKVLYVATEQKKDEIQTLILANISGVDEDKLLMGTMTNEEERRMRLASRIVEKYRGNLIIEYISDPSIGLARTKLVKHIYKSDVDFIFYDYIFSSPSLINEFQGASLREDVVLMMLSNTLKEIAAEHNIFIMSGTQLNGEWQKTTIRNANLIRGSKAIVDKVDVGCISVKLDAEEMSSIQALLEAGNYPMVPNMVTDVYKNRRGKLVEIKIFRNFDYGTCRIVDLFMTDCYYNLKTNYQQLVEHKTTVLPEDLLNGN